MYFILSIYLNFLLNHFAVIDVFAICLEVCYVYEVCGVSMLCSGDDGSNGFPLQFSSLSLRRKVSPTSQTGHKLGPLTIMMMVL